MREANHNWEDVSFKTGLLAILGCIFLVIDVAQPQVGSDILRQVVLDSLRKHTEKTMGSKPESSAPPHAFL